MQEQTFRVIFATSLIGNIIFLFANIGIVSINYFLPKYFSQADLSIQYVKASPTAEDIHIPSDVIDAIKEYYSFPSLDSPCNSQYVENSFTLRCIKDLSVHVRDSMNLTRAAIRDLIDEKAALAAIKRGVDQKTSISPELLYLQRFKLLVNNFVREELQEDAWNVAITSFESNLTYSLDYREKRLDDMSKLNDFITLILDSGRIGRDGNVLVEVGVLNSGEEDALIYPKGVMKIGGSDVVLRQMSNTPMTGLRGAENFIVVPANNFARLFFSSDENDNLPSSMDVLKNATTSKTSQEYVMVITDGSNKYERSGHLTLDIIWVRDAQTTYGLYY